MKVITTQEALENLKSSINDAVERYEFSDFKNEIDQSKNFNDAVKAVFVANLELFFIISVVSRRAEAATLRKLQEPKLEPLDIDSILIKLNEHLSIGGFLVEHHKGGLYELVIVSYSESDETLMAVYKFIDTHKIFVRPLKEFMTKFALVDGSDWIEPYLEALS